MHPNDLTHADLLELIRYEPETGKIFWRERDVKWFKDTVQTANHNQAIWNGKNAGKETFVSHSRGYLTSSIFNVTLQAHRVAFFYMVGRWPTEVNHIDKNRKNNKWNNLEEVTRKQNARNRTMQSNNTSGVTGVYWSNRAQRWIASVMLNQKKVSNKSFKNKEEASAWISKEYERLGFYPGHGQPQ